MIVRDGLPFILGSLAACLIALVAAMVTGSPWMGALAGALGVLTLLFTLFFRDPLRIAPPGENLVLAPADGWIVRVEPLAGHPYVGAPATVISIFLTVFDVHVNRVPAAGRIEAVEYHRGRFRAAFDRLASSENERTEIGLLTTGGHRVLFSQIAGSLARRIICRLSDGMTVSAGDRFGMIKFGSRSDVVLPPEARVLVSRGQHVRAGETVLGILEALESPSSVAQAMEGGHGTR